MNVDKKLILKQLKDHYNFKKDGDFADFLGIKPQVLSNWMARNTFDIEILYTKCVNISADWLLTGKGEMFEHPENPSILSEPETTYQPSCRPQQNGMPLIPVDAIGGYANGDVQVQAYEIDKYYVVHEFRERGAKFLIRVSGRSMEPTYNNGDLLACRPVAEVTFVQWGTVYVIDTVQGPIVKRLYECSNQDSDCIKCVSDNGEFPEFRITKKDIRALYMVVGVIRLD